MQSGKHSFFFFSTKTTELRFNVQISDGFFENSPCNRGFFMEIFPERGQKPYLKWEHFLGRQPSPWLFIVVVAPGWSCPFWAVHWKWRICCRTNWLANWWATERHGVFFCCWKEQTNNEIRTNKIEEVKETIKKHEERLGVQIANCFLASISSTTPMSILTTLFWLHCQEQPPVEQMGFLKYHRLKSWQVLKTF